MARKKNVGAPSIALLLLSPLNVIAEDYRNEAWHFSLVAPSGLSRMTPERLKTFQSFADRVPAGKVVYAAGFQANRLVPGTPYVLVQVHKIDMSRVTYAAIEKEYGAGLKKEAASAKEPFKEVIKELDFKDAAVDREKNRITFVGAMKGPNGEDVDLASAVMLGSQGLVTLHCYASDGRMKELLPGYRAMFDSFRYDAGFEFKERASLWNIIGNKTLAGAGAGAVVGGLVGAIAALVFVLRRTLAKK